MTPAYKILTAGEWAAVPPDGAGGEDGQIYRARVMNPVPADSMQRGEKPFIRNWGTQSAQRWSPDGKSIVFTGTLGTMSRDEAEDVLHVTQDRQREKADDDSGGAPLLGTEAPQGP